MSAHSHLNGLNTAQKEAVLHTSGPLLIVAGAGAGKTRTITHRIANLVATGIPAHRILAVTFTNKAAGEMRERLARLLPGSAGSATIATFHSLAVRILRELGKSVGVETRFTIWDRDDQMRAMKRVLKQREVEDGEPRILLSAISRQKGNAVSRHVYERDVQSFREKDVAEAWRMYEQELTAAGALDFDDLLTKTLELLRSDPRVLELLQARWTHITIDEYQDTNAVQYEIARLLAGSALNICAVGDLDQCIYTWRQARLENLLGFERSFPGTTVVRLEENYRSSGTIITAANAIIEKNKNRIPRRLVATKEIGEPILLYEAENETEEAWFVAREIKTLLARGEAAKDIAVLYRDNFQSRVLEEAFLSSDIPYRIIGTRFFERKEVKDVLSYVRIALNPKSAADFARVVGTPPRGIGKTTLAKIVVGAERELPIAARAKVDAFRGLLTRIRAALETLPLSEALQFIIEESGLARMYKEGRTKEDEERFENVRELVNLAVRFDSELPARGAELLLDEAALQSDQDELKEEMNAVSLMTIHASKGLEFGTVFVTGLGQGLFPSLRLDEHTDPEEERRLFYVALTRAKRLLYLTFARARFRYGSREHAVPSEFLGDIDPRLVSWAGAEPIIEA